MANKELRVKKKAPAKALAGSDADNVEVVKKTKVTEKIVEKPISWQDIVARHKDSISALDFSVPSEDLNLYWELKFPHLKNISEEKGTQLAGNTLVLHNEALLRRMSKGMITPDNIIIWTNLLVDCAADFGFEGTYGSAKRWIGVAPTNIIGRCVLFLYGNSSHSSTNITYVIDNSDVAIEWLFISLVSHFASLKEDALFKGDIVRIPGRDNPYIVKETHDYLPHSYNHSLRGRGRSEFIKLVVRDLNDGLDGRLSTIEGDPLERITLNMSWDEYANGLKRKVYIKRRSYARHEADKKQALTDLQEASYRFDSAVNDFVIASSKTIEDYEAKAEKQYEFMQEGLSNHPEVMNAIIAEGGQSVHGVCKPIWALTSNSLGLLKDIPIFMGPMQIRIDIRDCNQLSSTMFNLDFNYGIHCHKLSSGNYCMGEFQNEFIQQLSLGDTLGFLGTALAMAKSFTGSDCGALSITNRGALVKLWNMFFDYEVAYGKSKETLDIFIHDLLIFAGADYSMDLGLSGNMDYPYYYCAAGRGGILLRENEPKTDTHVTKVFVRPVPERVGPKMKEAVLFQVACMLYSFLHTTLGGFGHDSVLEWLNRDKIKFSEFVSQLYYYPIPVGKTLEHQDGCIKLGDVILVDANGDICFPKEDTPKVDVNSETPRESEESDPDVLYSGDEEAF